MVTCLCSQDPDEPEWLKDCHSPLWSPSYEPNYGSYVEEVKNTEPPDYIKELASSDGMFIPFFPLQELNPSFSWIDFFPMGGGSSHGQFPPYFITTSSVKKKLTIFHNMTALLISNVSKALVTDLSSLPYPYWKIMFTQASFCLCRSRWVCAK